MQFAHSAPGLTAASLRHSLIGDSKETLIQLPVELGQIDHIHTPDKRHDFPLVIHIQTTHGIYSGTKQLQKIINFLSDEYGIETLYVEGASESLRPEFMKFFDDEELNLEFADRLARAGWLTGAELGILQSHKKIKSFGIENASLYRDSYKNFKDVLNQKDHIETILRKQKLGLDKKASQILDSETREILDSWMNFQRDPTNLVGVLKQLENYANNRLKVDLNDPLKQFEWPQLARLIYLQKLEKKLENSDFEKEVKAIESNFGRIKHKQLLDSLNENQPHLPRLFYEDYFEKNGFILENYPQHIHKLAYQVLQSELSPQSISDEVRELFVRLIDAGAQTEDQKALIKKYRTWFLSSKLGRLELTRDDWELMTDEFFASTQKQSWMQVAREFYRLAVEREEIFLKKMLQSSFQNQNKPVVLITGGFHTNGMKDLFEKNKMAYMLLTPNLESLEGNTYHQIMLGKSYLEQTPLLQSAHSNLLHGWDVGNEAKNVFRLFRQFAQEQSLSRSETRAFWKRSSYAKNRARVLKKNRRSRVHLSIEKLEERLNLSGVSALPDISPILEPDNPLPDPPEIHAPISDEIPTGPLATDFQISVSPENTMNTEAVDAFFADFEETAQNIEFDTELLASNIHAVRSSNGEIILEIHQEGIDYLRQFDLSEVILTFEGIEGDQSQILITHDGDEEVQLSSLDLVNGEAIIHLEEPVTGNRFESHEVLVHVSVNEKEVASIEVLIEDSHGSDDDHDHDPGDGFNGLPPQNDDDHGGHDHGGHDHGGHDHGGHDHGGHDHGGHDHGGHDHGGHDHGGHDHRGHDHGGHDHKGHDHSTTAFIDSFLGSAGSNFGNRHDHDDHSHHGLELHGGSLESLRDSSPHSGHRHSHDSLNHDHRRHDHADSHNNLHNHNSQADLRMLNHRHIFPRFGPFWGYLKEFFSDSDTTSENNDESNSFDGNDSLNMTNFGPIVWRSLTVISFVVSAILSVRFWRKEADFKKRLRESRKRETDSASDSEDANPPLVTGEEKRRMQKMQWAYLATYSLSAFLLLAIPIVFFWGHPQNPVSNFVNTRLLNTMDQEDPFTDKVETTKDFLVFSRDMSFPQLFKQDLSFFINDSLSYEVSLPEPKEGQSTLVVFELMNQKREAVYSFTWMLGNDQQHYYHSNGSKDSAPPLFSYDAEKGTLKFSVPNRTIIENLSSNDQIPQLRVWVNRPNGVFSPEEQNLFGVRNFDDSQVDSWQEASAASGVIPRIEIQTASSIQSQQETFISRRFFAEIHDHGAYDSRAYNPRDFTKDIFINRGIVLTMDAWDSHDLNSFILQFDSGNPRKHTEFVRYVIEKKNDKWITKNGIEVFRRGPDLMITIPEDAVTSLGTVGSFHMEASFKTGDVRAYDLPKVKWKFLNGDEVPFALNEVYRLQQARYPTISLDEHQLKMIEHLNGSWISIPKRSGHMIQALDILLTDENGQNSLWSIKRPAIDPNEWRGQMHNLGLDQKGWKGSFRFGGNVQETPLQPVVENNDTVAFFIPNEILANQVKITPHVTFEAEWFSGNVGTPYSSFPQLSMSHTRAMPEGFEGVASTEIPASLKEKLPVQTDRRKRSSVLFDLNRQQSQDFRRLPSNSILEIEIEHTDISNWPEIHFHFQYFKNQDVTFFHPVATQKDGVWVLTDPNDPDNEVEMSAQYESGKLTFRIPSQRVLETSFYPLSKIGVSVGNTHGVSSSYNVKGSITISAQFIQPGVSENSEESEGSESPKVPRSEVRVITPFFLAFHVFGGMGGINWSEQERIDYGLYMREQLRVSSFGHWDPLVVQSQTNVLNDFANDSVGLPRHLNGNEDTPVIIQFISRALTVKDKALLISRLQNVPDGSVLIEYTEQGKASVLAAEMQNFSNLLYVRESYVGELRLATIKQKLARAQDLIGEGSESVSNTGFLLTGFEDLESIESDGVEELGLVFVLGDELVQGFAPHMQDSIRAAVFGRFIEYVKLDREIRDPYIQEEIRQGYLGIGGHAFNIESLWVDFRTQAHLSTQA